RLTAVVRSKQREPWARISLTPCTASGQKLTPKTAVVEVLHSKRRGLPSCERPTGSDHQEYRRDIFEGIIGRQPKSLEELEQWLATDEGIEATIFESTSASRWGAVGRS